LNGKPVVTLLQENPFEKWFSRPFPLRASVFQAKESITEKFLPGFFQKATVDLSSNRRVQFMTM